MSRRKSARPNGSKSIDPRAIPDTKPIYPRPLGARLQPVISDLLIDLENIAPGYYPLATLLVHQLRGRQYTVAESMWAIHEACHLGALKPIDRRFYSEPIETIVGEEHDIKIVDGRVEVGELLVGPSGIPLRPGRLHVDNKQNDLWGILVFEINHERVAELRLQRETATANSGGQSPADDGGTRIIESTAKEITEVERACEPLTPLQAKIVQFLWERKHAANFDRLSQNCWDDGAEDENIVTCLKRLKRRWTESGEADQFFLQLGLEISPRKRTVKLIRPEQKKGQK